MNKSPPSLSMTYLGKLTNDPQHGDVGKDAALNDVYVQHGGSDPRGSVLMWKLNNPLVTTPISLIPVSPSNPPNPIGINGGHISCRNINLPGWCFISGKGIPTSSTYWLGDDEVFALKLDTTKTVRRFAHMHQHYDNTVYYDHQSMGSPDRDGKRVLFRSDWNGANPNVTVADPNAEVNSYVAYNASLIPNGGFEFGLTGWNNYTGGGLTIVNNGASDPVYLGKTSVRAGPGGTGGTGGYSTKWVQNVVAGKQYRLSALTKATQATGDTKGAVYIQFFDANNSVENMVGQFSLPTISTTNYGYQELIVTAPPGSAKLRATVWKNSGPGLVYADQLMIVEW